jgi:hypothetical protein
MGDAPPDIELEFGFEFSLGYLDDRNPAKER